MRQNTCKGIPAHPFLFCLNRQVRFTDYDKMIF